MLEFGVFIPLKLPTVAALANTLAILVVRQKMISIRQIEITDIPELFRVRASTDENRLRLEELARLGINETSVKAKLLGSYKGWLCEDEGRIVGFAIGDRSSGEMWVIAVLPSHIGRGIGSALLGKVDEWLLNEGCPELWLTTDIDTRLRAYSFYQRHGWSDWKIEDGLRYMKKRPNQAVNATATRVTPHASALPSGQESRHGQP